MLTYIGLYIIFLVVLWTFFIVAKFHAYKFKYFSNHIIAVTRFLFIFLLTLSILGFVLIFIDGSDSNNTVKVNIEEYDNEGLTY